MKVIRTKRILGPRTFERFIRVELAILGCLTALIVAGFIWVLLFLFFPNLSSSTMLIIIGLVLLVPGCIHRKFLSRFISGNRALIAGNINEAIVSYEQFLSHYHLNSMKRLLQILGDTNNAYNYDTLARLNLSDCYFEQGFIDKARAILKTIDQNIPPVQERMSRLNSA